MNFILNVLCLVIGASFFPLVKAYNGTSTLSDQWKVILGGVCIATMICGLGQGLGWLLYRVFFYKKIKIIRD